MDFSVSSALRYLRHQVEVGRHNKRDPFGDRFGAAAESETRHTNIFKVSLDKMFGELNSAQLSLN